MNGVTRILTAMRGGDAHAAEELLPEVYTELRRLAARRLAWERPGQTLQATALVHEAWLRLEKEHDRQWNDSHHFFCAAATAMRRILIENARRKRSRKHGGHLSRVSLENVTLAEQLPGDQLQAVDDALTRLAEQEPRVAKLVELRFFAGLGHQEAARTMNISRRQADGLWAYARAWLFDALQKEFGANGEPRSP